MIRVGNHRRKPATRLAILTIALLQLAIAMAPHTGSFTASNANRPHLHAAGDRLELAHDETACPTCSNPTISSPAISFVKLREPEPTRVTIVAGQLQIPTSYFSTSSVLSRAPPSAA
jgi:hypothetical protein